MAPKHGILHLNKYLLISLICIVTSAPGDDGIESCRDDLPYCHIYVPPCDTDPDFIKNKCKRRCYFCKYENMPHYLKVPVLRLISSDIASDNLSVAEHQAVTFQCTGYGWPNPTVSIFKQSNTDITLENKNGQHATDWQSKRSHNIDEQYESIAKCEDSGHYQCLVSNTYENRVSIATLFVRCSPRLLNDTTNATRVNTFDISNELTDNLTFDIVAYPVPEMKFEFRRTSSSLNTSAVRPDLLSGACTMKDVIYESSCLVTIHKASKGDEGFYHIILENEIGSTSLELYLKFSDKTSGMLSLYLIIADYIVFFTTIVLLMAKVKAMGNYTRRSTRQRHMVVSYRRLKAEEGFDEKIKGYKWRQLSRKD